MVFLIQSISAVCAADFRDCQENDMSYISRTHDSSQRCDTVDSKPVPEETRTRSETVGNLEIVAIASSTMYF